MFHSFFNFQAKSRYVSFFLLSFNFTLWSGRQQSSQFCKFSFLLLLLLLLLVIMRSGRLWSVRWSVCTLKTPEEFVRLIFQNRFWAVHIPVVRMVKFNFLAQFPVDHLAHPVVPSFILFLCLLLLLLLVVVTAVFHIYFYYLLYISFLFMIFIFFLLIMHYALRLDCS